MTKNNKQKRQDEYRKAAVTNQKPRAVETIIHTLGRIMKSPRSCSCMIGCTGYQYDVPGTLL